MGLDAVVFRNVQNLEMTFGHGLFEVDETTGEAILKSNVNIGIPRDAYFAVRRRLGNFAEGSWLRDAAGQILTSDDVVMMRRVLQSTSHSGDSIKPDEYPRLRMEIDRLKMLGGTDLKAFVEAMEALLDSAEAEGNPIVFV